MLKTKITNLLGLHLALQEENFEHDVRCLGYVFEGDMHQIPFQMKNNPVSFWQEKVRNNVFTIKNLSATQIYNKLLAKEHSYKYYKECLSE